MVGRAVENILRLRIGRQDRGFVDLDLGIAEVITGAEIESADPPRERRSGVDRIEVGDIAGVADEQAAARALPEIGRASCRERGTQYGQISGGAVTLKKTKIKNT